jgi:hypothetical protein
MFADTTPSHWGTVRRHRLKPSNWGTVRRHRLTPTSTHAMNLGDCPPTPTHTIKLGDCPPTRLAPHMPLNRTSKKCRSFLTFVVFHSFLVFFSRYFLSLFSLAVFSRFVFFRSNCNPVLRSNSRFCLAITKS